MAKTSVLIPAYIDYRITYIKNERKNTRFGQEFSNSLKKKRDAEALNANERVIVRKISAVRIINTSSSTAVGRTYNPPTFEVSISGFWRYFANKEWQGKDENGNSVLGKTWVKPHSRYKEHPNKTDSQKIVYLKSKIPNVLHAGAEVNNQKAKEQFSKIDVHELPKNAETNENQEYLYVMVNPAHKTGLFKVGYTTRTPEERARELSSNTANPAHYLVVESWQVKDGKMAEKEVHRKLDKYRLAGNREFFQVGYEILRGIIIGSIRRE